MRALEGHRVSSKYPKANKTTFNTDQPLGKTGQGKIRGKKAGFETGFETFFVSGFETGIETGFEPVMVDFFKPVWVVR